MRSRLADMDIVSLSLILITLFAAAALLYLGFRFTADMQSVIDELLGTTLHVR
jgi:hypothetical protein